MGNPPTAMAPIIAAPRKMPTLSVENTPSSPASHRVSHDAQRLIINVLVFCKFTGDWTLRYKEPVAGRTNARFRAKSKDEDSGVIRIITRPGDNGTRWEWALTPPAKYALGDVFAALRKVPTNARVPRVATPKSDKAVAAKQKKPVSATAVARLDTKVNKLAKALGLSMQPVRIPGCNMYACFVPLSPDMAYRWLVDEKRNEHNRSLNMRTVWKYAEDIKQAFWVDTPQGIMFNINGDLLDGQNRVRAVFEVFGAAVPMMVFLNVPDEAQRGIDHHRTRSLVDTAVLWATDLRGGASAARRLITGPLTGNGNLSDAQICETIAKHEEAYDWMKTQFAKKVKYVTTSPVMAACGRAYYYCDQTKLEEFIYVLYEQVATVKNHPAIALHRVLTSGKRVTPAGIFCRTTRLLHINNESDPDTRADPDAFDKYRVIPDTFDRWPLPANPVETLERKRLEDVANG